MNRVVEKLGLELQGRTKNEKSVTRKRNEKRDETNLVSCAAELPSNSSVSNSNGKSLLGRV